jgi:ubiquinone/menaquinone biosynthesis C-methylase UbiE
MSVQQAYNEWSLSYDSDRNLTRDLDRRVTATCLGDERFQSILEVGCGTGKNSQLLARIGGRLAGLDFAAGMLQRARQKVVAGHVSFVVADVTQPWPCAAQTADLVTCNLVLEHVADLPFIFGQAARALAAGGRLFVCELHPFRQYAGAKATYQGREAAVEIEAFVHHVSDFLTAAGQAGLALCELREWWDGDNRQQPPRLLSLLFEK